MMNTLPRSTKLAALLGPVVLVLAIIYSAMLPMPPSALELPAEKLSERAGSVFFPQGWAFFTKSPRTPELVAMTDPTATGDFDRMNYGPNAQPQWFFGADRTSRIQEFEFELLNRSSKDTDWFSCEQRVSTDCVARLVAADLGVAEVSTPFPAATICGNVVLVRTGVTPWAYANKGFDDNSTIDEIKRLKITCERSL